MGTDADNTKPPTVAMSAVTDDTHTEANDEVVLAVPQTPKKRRFQLKYIVLLLLVFQNSATTMLVRYTRTPRPGQILYLGSMAVLVSELLKFPTCLALISRDEGGVRGMLRTVWNGVFVRWRDTLRMGVPALCYGIQNALFFVALSNLSASSYQIWSQSKTLFTALFFVNMLGQTLKLRQWFALALLTIGVCLVQLGEGAAGAAAAVGVPAIGVAAVLASSLSSGFANIYFEKVLKQADCKRVDDCPLDKMAPASLWLRNVQLGMFAIPQAAAFMLCSKASREVIAAHGILAGFTPAVWMVTMMTAGGGLLIAAVVKHADNLLKTYATAVAIVLTAFITSAATGVPPTPGFLRGMSLVLTSIFLYNVDPAILWRRSKPAPPAAGTH